MAWTVKICDFQGIGTCEAGTDSSNIKITGHGLDVDDFIVNETRRGKDAERASRLVFDTGLTANNIPIYTPITGQTTGDRILLFPYTDHTSAVKAKTLKITRKAGGNSEASFQLKSDIYYTPRAGQYVRIKNGSDIIFGGVIQTVTRKRMDEGSSCILYNINCSGFNQIPSRRTIRVNYSLGTKMGDIVTDMVEDYLYQDGIGIGTINDGTTLTDDWKDDAISISEILDQCATKSGYQWFINEAGLLNFYQDPGVISNAAHNLIDGNGFTNYRNVEYQETLSNYQNKLFIVGGDDEVGNPILISSEDYNESTAMQEIAAGTGVYGAVNRDGSITESEYKTAESGTTATNVKITGHGQQVGYMIWNVTTGDYRLVTAYVDANNFTVDSVTGQTTGDTIVLFNEANNIIQNAFKRQGILPGVLTFETDELDFEPATKLRVELDDLSISDSYYNIEEVELSDVDGVNMQSKVKAVKRNNSNFTTQRMPNYADYWGGF